MLNEKYSLLIEECLKLIRMNTVVLIKIKESSHLLDDLGLEGEYFKDMVEIFENHFQVKFPEKELPKLETVAELIDLVAKSAGRIELPNASPVTV